MRTAATVVVIALVGSVAGCGRPPNLVNGPIDLTASAMTFRFVQPVPSQGVGWELCFEFDLPGDSHHADAIHATLVSSSGSRAALGNQKLDRRGESTVCQIGQLAAVQPDPAGTIYESVELFSDRPLRLRGIRGGSRS